MCLGTMKKPLATWGLEPASPISVNRHAMLLTIIHPQKIMQQAHGREHSMFVD